MEPNEIKQKTADLKAVPFDSTNRYRAWETYLAKYHCDVVCEIGVKQGFHFAYLIAHNPREAVAIDCWGGPADKLPKFKRSVADKPFVKILQKYSMEAVKDFPDEYFDYIFVDADHTYEGISKDLTDWYPKVKKGGIFCGHDYVVAKRCGVIQAVDEFVKKNNITTFFVLTPNPTWVMIKI